MEKLNVAIAEDNETALKFIKNQLKDAFFAKDIQLSFDCYVDNSLLLQEIRKGKEYSILFLDIEMPGLQGIELSQRLRETGYERPLVFISNKTELVFQSFEVRPFRFVRKNHFIEELPKLVEDLISELHSNAGAAITIEESNSSNIYTFKLQDIMYIEVIGKFCNVTSIHGTTTIKQPLSTFEDLLVPHGFLKPHRSFLVNYKYIFSISNTCVILDNRHELPLSRKRIDDIKNDFIYLMQKNH